MAFEIKRAVRSAARMRLGISGTSGSGKTMGALLLAKGLVHAIGRDGDPSAIVLIDSERKSAQLYADVVPFETIELDPPYSPERYCEAITAAEQHGAVVTIIDQISHAWAGPGGLLEYVDSLKANAKHAMSPWAKATPKQQEFVDRMLRCETHLIATMRSKTEWVIEKQIRNGREISVPRKVGMAPVQRDGIEYEFTTMLDVDSENHMAVATKDRTRIFGEQSIRIDESLGMRLAEWLQNGAALAPAEPHAFFDKPMTPTRRTELWEECQRTAAALSISPEALWLDTLKELGLASKKELKEAHYKDMEAMLKKPLDEHLSEQKEEDSF